MGPAVYGPTFITLGGPGVLDGLRLAMPVLAVLFMAQVALAFVVAGGAGHAGLLGRLRHHPGLGAFVITLVLPDLGAEIAADMSQVTGRIESVLALAKEASAVSDSDSDKTEDATPERRRKAREEGQFPRAKDTGALAATIAILVTVSAMGGGFWDMLRAFTRRCFSEGLTFKGAGIGYIARELATLLLAATLPHRWRRGGRRHAGRLR